MPNETISPPIQSEVSLLNQYKNPKNRKYVEEVIPPQYVPYFTPFINFSTRTIGGVISGMGRTAQFTGKILERGITIPYKTIDDGNYGDKAEYLDPTRYKTFNALVVGQALIASGRMVQEVGRSIQMTITEAYEDQIQRRYEQQLLTNKDAKREPIKTFRPSREFDQAVNEAMKNAPDISIQDPESKQAITRAAIGVGMFLGGSASLITGVLPIQIAGLATAFGGIKIFREADQRYVEINNDSYYSKGGLTPVNAAALEAELT